MPSPASSPVSSPDSATVISFVSPSSGAGSSLTLAEGAFVSGGGHIGVLVLAGIAGFVHTVLRLLLDRFIFGEFAGIIGVDPVFADPTLEGILELNGAPDAYPKAERVQNNARKANTRAGLSSPTGAMKRKTACQYGLVSRFIGLHDTPYIFSNYSTGNARAWPSAWPSAAPTKALVCIGSYSAADKESVHLYQLNLKDGSLKKLSAVSGLRNPSFLKIHPNGKFLYAVNEVGDFQDKKSGGVTAFGLDVKNGKLTQLNQQPSGDTGPCHLTVDATGKFVLVAHYGGGSTTVLPIKKDGHVGPVSSQIEHKGSSVLPRQKAPPRARHSRRTKQ